MLDRRRIPSGLLRFEPALTIEEDYEFLLRAAKVHPVVNVSEVLAAVRWGKQSFFFRRWETMAAGLTWLLRRYPEFDSSRPGSARIWRCSG